MVGNRLAGQVDDGIGAVEFDRPWRQHTLRIPGDDACTGNRGPVAAGEDDDRVAVGQQCGDQGAAEEACCAGDDNLHGLV